MERAESAEARIEARGLCKQFERTVSAKGDSSANGAAGRRKKRSGKGDKRTKEEFLAVDHVSLAAHSGEIVGILGPNGAGKTTLLRMLGMLMTPTEGEVVLRARDGSEILDVTAKKAAIGYLSGNTKLYPNFSVREYLQFLGDIYGMTKESAAAQMEEIFRVLDMHSFADNRMGKLSTGQTQRASIARCLMADPQVYIMDEPTLGLDILSADAIVQFMKAQKERGKTVLYSTHYLEEAQFLCDRIYMICGGRIAAQGTPQALMEQTGTATMREAFHVIYHASGNVAGPLGAPSAGAHRANDSFGGERGGEFHE